MANKTEKSGSAFTAEERDAMKEHAAEVKASRSRKGSKEEKAAADAEAQLAKIAELEDGDRKLAERVQEVVLAAVPALAPKLWYGMPAYYLDGKLICFFQPASKFKARYSTLGFEANAALDDGDMWPTAFAVLKLSPSVEKRITELVKTAAG
jgi:uncharacterized protein YdhG (YjbR/CyaY superfamily)